MEDISLLIAIMLVSQVMMLQAILRLSVRVHKLEEKNGED